MLNKTQKKELIDTVEEELIDIDRYPHVALSEVEAFKIDGYTVYVKVVSDDYYDEEE